MSSWIEKTNCPQSMVFVNPSSSYELVSHNPHYFDTKDLSVDIFKHGKGSPCNLFEVVAGTSFEVDLYGRRLSVSCQNSQFVRMFGTFVLPNIGDYLELVVDTLFEIKSEWIFKEIRTTEEISDEVIVVRIPFVNILEVSVIVNNDDFTIDGESFALIWDKVKWMAPKSKWSLKIETDLKKTPSTPIDHIYFLKAVVKNEDYLFTLLSENLHTSLTKLELSWFINPDVVYGVFNKCKFIDTFVFKWTETLDKERDKKVIDFWSQLPNLGMKFQLSPYDICLEVVDIHFELTKTPQIAKAVVEYWTELLSKQTRIKMIKYNSINRPPGLWRESEFFRKNIVKTVECNGTYSQVSAYVDIVI